MNRRRFTAGFALPTVVITSVVMFALLVAAVAVVASTTSSLDIQYYEQLASDAAESGATQADSCLQSNSYVSSWGSGQLTPATDCTGAVVAGQSPNIISTPSYRSTYTVTPVTSSPTGTQTATVTGTLSLVRRSGVVWKTMIKTLVVKTGGQIGATQVAFGYVQGTGAFFGVVGGDGVMRTVGFNGQGQLGNGTLTDTLTPSVFRVPSTSRIVAGYSNFLSDGLHMYAIDSQGVAWGAGQNNFGSVGVGVPEAASATITTPRQVLIPGTAQVRYVVTGHDVSYFLTADNKVYASGSCAAGQLGSNYGISGCADQATPVRVNLPTPNLADPNTIPTTNFVIDRDDAYVRMAGGAVYGWGAGDLGQLGQDAMIASSTPVKIGTFGDAGSPKATQIAFDGDTLYVLDSTGHVNSLGQNSFGEMGSDTMSLFMRYASRKCMDNTNADGVSLQLYSCDGTGEQKFAVRSDGSVYNANKDVCLDNANADGVTLRLWSCNGSAAQKFDWDPNSGQLYNAQADKCVDNVNSDGATLQLDTCDWSAEQEFTGYNANLTALDGSSIDGAITKIWTDQWSLSALTSSGDVWSVGLNSMGQFGDGTTAVYQPSPVQFAMPVKAVDIYETYSADLYQNLYAIGSDGRVYGAGSNSFGQLGNGTMSAYVATPVVMSVINGATIVAKQVQSGFGTTIVFTTNGSVYTVGNNGSGQLGDGTTTNSSTPIKAQYINHLSAETY